MEKLARFGLTQRTALLLLLLTALSVSGVLLVPKDAEAACCGWDITTEYYFDAAKTQYAGQCWINDCTGSVGCSGTTPTPYWTRYRSCCEICQH
jgi:hypothetical protein